MEPSATSQALMNIPEKFQKNHELARYSTFQVGGPADWFLDAENVEDVLEALKWADESGVRVFVFGGGTNLIFEDSGFRGLVVRMKAAEVKVETNGAAGEDGLVFADAGVKIAALVRAAAEAELTGLESWMALPGTVGGAVFGNAGCFGVETKDVLESAEVFVSGEGVKEFGLEELEYEYRNSKLKKLSELMHVREFVRGRKFVRAHKSSDIDGAPVVLRAVFRLKKGDPEEIRAKMAEVMKRRAETQPVGSTAGSFFKNPKTPVKGEDGVEAPRAAGWLIDQCGLKGKRVGGAQISEKHANFFLNKGGATAADIMALGKLAADAVREKFGIELEREVVFVAAE